MLAWLVTGSCTVHAECKTMDLSCDLLGFSFFGRSAFPRFVYSGNLGGGSVASYALDYSSGTISSSGSVAATPGCVAVHPGGQMLYSANGGANTITSFFVNQSTGSLTSATSNPATGTSGLAIDSGGTFLYSLNATTNLVETYLLNALTGSATFVSSTTSGGTGPNFIAMHGNGQLLYIANSTAGNVSAFVVNPTTGAVTLLGQSTLAVARGVAVDPFGRFVYATDNTSVLKVFRIAANGSLTQISTVATGVFNTFVATTPDGRFVYTTNQTSNDVSVLYVQDNGILLNLANRPAGSGPIGISVEPTGKFLFVGNAGAGTVMVYSINRLTGDITLVDTKAAAAGSQSIAFSNRYTF